MQPSCTADLVCSPVGVNLATFHDAEHCSESLSALSDPQLSLHSRGHIYLGQPGQSTTSSG